MKSQTETTRVVFFSGGEDRYYTEVTMPFMWHMGMSWQVKQRSSLSLRESIQSKYPNKKIIEISTASDNYELGKKLSAFNLTLNNIPVENLFQGSKVFSDNTGPFTDIYFGCSPKEAKVDPRIKAKKGHEVIGFKLNTHGIAINFESYPFSAFYDYIYILALSQHQELADEIIKYDVFTDINFNQKIPYSTKGPFNCQARSLAIYVELAKRGEISQYLQKPNEFIDKIYSNTGRLF